MWSSQTDLVVRRHEVARVEFVLRPEGEWFPLLLGQGQPPVVYVCACACGLSRLGGGGAGSGQKEHATAPTHKKPRPKPNALEEALHRLTLAHVLRLAARQHLRQQLRELAQRQWAVPEAAHPREPAGVLQREGRGDGLCARVCGVRGESGWWLAKARRGEARRDTPHDPRRTQP